MIERLITAATEALNAADAVDRDQRGRFSGRVLTMARQLVAEVDVLREHLRNTPAVPPEPPAPTDIPIDGLSQGRLGALLTRLEREEKTARRAGGETGHLERQIGRVKEKLWQR